ncbi:MAG: hypothetical protein ABIN58_04945, partial [candidate division WOR-3 bacterium]
KVGAVAGAAIGKAMGPRGEGVIYERTNPITGAKYIGQAKSVRRFVERMAEENADLGVQHTFRILERAKLGRALDVAEETAIRRYGGPRTKGQRGPLENARYQMNDAAYRSAGGRTSMPTPGSPPITP